MICPNCEKSLIYLYIDDQRLWHCANCGGTFFEENGINRITSATAQTLSQDKKVDEISVGDKLCPKDQTVLSPIQSDESIPKDITLLRCDTCFGIFVYPDDLLNFKKAQRAKLDYFKLWNIPLPSVSSIAIISITIFLSVLGFTAYIYWQQQGVSHIQAQDLVKNLYITTSNRYLFVSFKTEIPIKSRIIFTDQTTNQTIDKVISSEPKAFHQLTTTDVNFEDEIYYQIILMDDSGKELKTGVKRLEIK